MKRRLVLLHFLLTLAFPLASFADGMTVSLVPAPSRTEHILGRRNAPVTVIVYSDFECPACKFHHATLRRVIRKYRTKVNVVYRNFPLPMHSFARDAAVAGECIAKEKGNAAYWQYIYLIYENGTAKYAQMADAMALSPQDLEACRNAGEADTIVDRQLAEGKAADIWGTPTNFIYSRKTGSMVKLGVAAPDMEKLTSLIDKLLVE